MSLKQPFVVFVVGGYLLKKKGYLSFINNRLKIDMLMDIWYLKTRRI